MSLNLSKCQIVGNHMPVLMYSCWLFSHDMAVVSLGYVYLFVCIDAFISQLTIVQSCRDIFWVGPVRNKDTSQCLQ